MTDCGSSRKKGIAATLPITATPLNRDPEPNLDWWLVVVFLSLACVFAGAVIVVVVVGS
jgi:hypothetical protein